MSLVVWRQSPNHNIWWCYRRVLPHMLWFGCKLPLLQILPHGLSTARPWRRLVARCEGPKRVLLQPRVGVQAGEPEVPRVGQQDRHKADHKQEGGGPTLPAALAAGM